MKFFNNLSVKRKFIFITVIFMSFSIIASMIFISFNIYFEHKSDMIKYEEEEITNVKKAIKNYITIAYKIIEYNYNQSKDTKYIVSKYGKRTPETEKMAEIEAKDNTKKIIRELIFDENDKGYFWINDTKKPFPEMIMHPKLPGLDGTILKNEKYNTVGIEKQNLFQAAVEICESDGEGYISYKWPEPTKDGLSRIDLPKESFVKLFKEWNWIIGNGYYIHYIDKKVEENKKEMRYELFKLIIVNIIISLIIIILNVVVIIFIVSKMLDPLSKMKRIVNDISSGDLTKQITIKTNDEIGEMSGYFNQLGANFNKVITKVKKSTEVLINSIQNLTVTSREISTTSNQQAASVKEIVSTMEDSDKLAKNIAGKINEVAKISLQTKNQVDRGLSFIKRNLYQMNEIKKSNSNNIEGIKNLGEKIENIWEIVNIINNIADQTKIIAFNAELEASAAGDAGKNFQIVASEIRRLADNTVTSTNEIKTRINEIQHSSDNLIVASEEETKKIKDGWFISMKLRKVFDIILGSSNISANSASQIAASINQQAQAFEQILLTLKQISEGIDNFVTSTKSTSETSDVIKTMVEDLNLIIENYKV